MFRVVVVVCLVCLVAGVQPVDAVGTTEPRGQNRTDVTEPHIVELYPNPPTDGDRDEFVTVALPPDTEPGAYELTDGHTSVGLGVGPTGGPTNGTNVTTGGPGVWSGGIVTFSGEPNTTASLTDRNLAPLGGLELANDGDRLVLRRGGETVDTVGYDRAPEGSVYDASAGTWQPLGATNLSVASARGGRVEAFVLPDAGGRAVELLERAEDRILLAGYTLSSPAVASALRSAHDRGVSVEVLVDGAPIGGTTGQQAATLDSLARAGIPVRVLDGEYARYRHHHAKYAVVDDRALVTTENWKPAGVGGRASRGWGVVTNQTAVVSALVELYRADTGWVDTVPWADHDPTLVEDYPARGSFPASFEPRELPVEQTSLLVTPDNARRELRTVIERAEESVDILQVSVDGGFSLLEAAIAAAGRGVEVRLLLSGAWYTREENRRLLERLERRAERADLPLSVRLVEPGGAFERLHAKGLIVDGERVYVGSLNWNEQAATENREVGLLLEGEAVGAYFERVFEADWRRTDDGEFGLPLGVALAVLAGVVAAILVARRIQFADDDTGVVEAGS